MLQENYIDDNGNITVKDKVQIAIDRLKAFEPPEGYWLAFSGGKDSVALKGVADLAGVKYEAHYSLTTVDPPELVRFIKTFPDVTIDKPEISMWRLIEKKGIAPTRRQRYCCSYFKESGGRDHVTLTGVRWAESVKRKKNRNLIDIGDVKNKIVYNTDNDEAQKMVQTCYKNRKTIVNPIIDWTDNDVWEFIKTYNIRYCPLYDEGWKRLGCIGCPLTGKDMILKEFERWPKYKNMYIRAFDKMIDARKKKGKTINIETGEEYFEWWVNSDKKKSTTYDGQIEMDELEYNE